MPHVLLFALAAVGISESIYLIRARRAGSGPVCPVGTGCQTVLTSRYNRLLLGLHNDTLGLVMYCVLTVLTALLVLLPRPPEWIPLVIMLMLAGATMVSVVLVYLQWRVIRAWCFWCLMSAATIVLMDIVVLTAQLSVSR